MFIVERHPTGIRLNQTSTRIRKLKQQLGSGDAPNYVHVRVLPPESSRGVYELAASGLKIETRGYWKTLPIGENGTDRLGRKVQGKTWVTEQRSWFEENIGDSEPNDEKVGVRIDDFGGEGTIYVLRNPQHPKDTYKVGYTTKTADERASQLSGSTGQPDGFAVVQDWAVKAPRKIEAEVHRRLKSLRVNNSREFFRSKYSAIRECIEQVIDEAGAAL